MNEFYIPTNDPILKPNTEDVVAKVKLIAKLEGRQSFEKRNGLDVVDYYMMNDQDYIEAYKKSFNRYETLQSGSDYSAR